MAQIKDTRIKNTKRNLVSGFIYRVISIFLPFAVRTAILYVMGEYYTGLTSLFSSILQVLNLAELGFSSAIVCNMYKPLAEEDTEQVCALLAYYKKIYYWVGGFIFIAGMALMPWLPRFINGIYPDNINIYLLYFLYLVNTVSSYWLFAYKSALITAAQRIDVQNKIYTVTAVLSNIAHFVVIVVMRNFYLYVLVSIGITAINNFCIEIVTKKYYPQYKCSGALDLKTRGCVRKQAAGIMVEKLGDTSRNSFDSIILSSFIGLTAVTIYSNYYYIFGSIYGLLLTITNSMAASVGNSVTKESVEKNYADLRRFQFIFSGIICVCTVCLVCLYQPFMRMWAGEKLMLTTQEMLLFCIYFFILNSNNMGQMYFATNGLWWKSKIYTLMEAIGNLILNIILGRFFGMTGVLLATIVTIFFLQFLPRTYITFKYYFKKAPIRYYGETISYGVVTLFACMISYLLCGWVNANGLLIRLIISVLTGSIIYISIFSGTKLGKDAFVYSLNAIKHR